MRSALIWDIMHHIVVIFTTLHCKLFQFSWLISVKIFIRNFTKTHPMGSELFHADYYDEANIHLSTLFCECAQRPYISVTIIYKNKGVTKLLTVELKIRLGKPRRQSMDQMKGWVTRQKKRLNIVSTHSMEQSPSWEANWFSASQEIPPILRNPKVHYRGHKCLPPVRILGQLNPVHTPTSHFLKIHHNIILPSMPGSPKWSLSLRFFHQNPVYASPPYALHAPPI